MKTTFDAGTTVPVIIARGIIRAVNNGKSTSEPNPLFERVIRAFETWGVLPTNRVVDISTTA